jgi:hypothetical protein
MDSDMPDEFFGDTGQVRNPRANGFLGSVWRCSAGPWRTEQGEQDSPDPVAVVRSRGEARSELGAGLKKLAEVWQPLCQTPIRSRRTACASSHRMSSI